jgi:hypothetical protein
LIIDHLSDAIVKCEVHLLSVRMSSVLDARLTK